MIAMTVVLGIPLLPHRGSSEREEVTKHHPLNAKRCLMTEFDHARVLWAVISTLPKKVPDGVFGIGLNAMRFFGVVHRGYPQRRRF